MTVYSKIYCIGIILFVKTMRCLLTLLFMNVNHQGLNKYKYTIKTKYFHNVKTILSQGQITQLTQSCENNNYMLSYNDGRPYYDLQINMKTH